MLLNAKYIPFTRYGTVMQSVIEREIGETHRKAVWRRYIMDNSPPGEVDKPQRFGFSYTKGTMPTPTLMAVLETEVQEVFSRIQRETEEFYALIRPRGIQAAGPWRRSLQEITATKKGRFILCDKNLGMIFLRDNMFKAIAMKEIKKYERWEITNAKDAVEKERLILTILQQETSALCQNTGSAVNAIMKTARERSTKGKPRVFLFEQDQLAFLKELREIGMHSSQKSVVEYSLPRMKLLVKVHKSMKEGIYQTRPIIPACGLPFYELAGWFGKFLAKMAKRFEWAITCTRDFQNWLHNGARSKNLKVYDFTNLYGSEPVKATLDILKRALYQLEWDEWFVEKDDKVIFAAMSQEITVYEEVGVRDLIGERSTLLMLFAAYFVKTTIAKLELEKDKVALCGTASFLAMGMSPVGPISVITLGMLELEAFGEERCKRGFCRYIDDIILDTDVVTEVDLRAIYPTYLELNNAEDTHYLDVAFAWNGKGYDTWPYVKPYYMIPLNTSSCHPASTLRAVMRNELLRLLNLCKGVETAPWVQMWYEKFRFAGHEEKALRTAIKEVAEFCKVEKVRSEVGNPLTHIETWRGVKTTTCERLSQLFGIKVRSARKMQQSIQSIALKAHRDSWKKQ